MPMDNSKLYFRMFMIPLSSALLLLGCNNSPTTNSNIDPALNGSWADQIQSGAVKVYITVLKFNNGNFEWTFDEDLQQRGVYDTKDGVLTVTIENSYDLRSLSDYSRKYSINENVLTWGGSQYIKK
jgi:hypothetical protein